jgi:hypothetical protein
MQKPIEGRSILAQSNVESAMPKRGMSVLAGNQAISMLEMCLYIRGGEVAESNSSFSTWSKL